MGIVIVDRAVDVEFLSGEGGVRRIEVAHGHLAARGQRKGEDHEEQAIYRSCSHRMKRV